MNSSSQDQTRLGFARNFLLPALMIFVVPGFSLFFFQYAQDKFDKQLREANIANIRRDTTITEDQRAQFIKVFETVPFSQMVQNEEFAKQVDSGLKFDYATFRWMIRLSFWSLVGGAAIFVLAAICSIFATSSQLIQFFVVASGWHILRLYSALQSIALGLMTVALSYWVTAIWLHIYIPYIIFVAGFLAICAVWLVVKAIFTPPPLTFEVEGAVLKEENAAQLWRELRMISQLVGSEPPDQVIVGIDDNFFVSELPISIGEQTFRGKTLFVSLSLLKQLDLQEARTILAHELAHFSGRDTLYARRIAPLMLRFDNYLEALNAGVITLPVFHFMVCFRVMFELSLKKLNRAREFRADRISVEATSPRDAARAMIRTIAYSHFRAKVESELFGQEEVLESANVSERIAAGFPEFATGFLAKTNFEELEPPHPFDSHPPLVERLAAIGMSLDSYEISNALTIPGDGEWLKNIPDSEGLERQQWQEYEQRFRDVHEQSLAYRYLPETPEEREFVERRFPLLTFTGKDGSLTLDCESVEFSAWGTRIHFSEIHTCNYDDHGVLTIHYNREKLVHRSFKITKFPKEEQGNVLEAFQNYYGRYLGAVEYQQNRKLVAENGDQPHSGEET